MVAWGVGEGAVGKYLIFYLFIQIIHKYIYGYPPMGEEEEIDSYFHYTRMDGLYYLLGGSKKVGVKLKMCSLLIWAWLQPCGIYR